MRLQHSQHSWIETSPRSTDICHLEHTAKRPFYRQVP